MKISYRIEKEDFVAAQKLHRSKGQTRVSRASGIVILVLYILLLIPALIFMATDRSLWPVLVRPLLIFGIVWGAMYWVLPPFLWRRSYSKDRRYQQQLTADFSENVVELQGGTFDSTAKWEHFLKPLESDRLFLLYVSPRMFHMFPKRSFLPGEADQFRELLHRKLPSH